MPHHLSPELTRRPVHVLIVGCGGNGSAITAGLPYLHQAMLVHGHPGGLEVTLMDGDVVSPTNCVRQPFSQAEIGHSKAVVLVSRMNLFWGLKWHAVADHFSAKARRSRTQFLGLRPCMTRPRKPSCSAAFPRFWRMSSLAARAYARTH